MSSVSDAPVRLPKREQYAGASDELSREVVMELDADPVNLDRYQLYTTYPASATPSDVCWVTRVTLHAMEKMPEMERDFILMPAIIDAASSVMSDDARPAQAPLPFPAKPPAMTIPCSSAQDGGRHDLRRR
ncbi:hypothetical protein H3V53_39910 [Paraburkholderia bengalensis]|uniref:Uncharacterized protein n=1 Tax=Paraburkholderia bengalensis TaxID=2747562 RepID=A0ABU8J5K1_9BURK